MGAVVAIDALLEERRVWKGRPAPRPASGQPTGHAGLDAALPIGGWPEGALSEILIPADGVGELRLLWPALARLTQAGERVVWRRNVYVAKWWTSGEVPDDPTLADDATPWRLIGPVLPGETPAPEPTVPPGTSRLRVSLTLNATPADVVRLAETLEALWPSS